MRCSWSAAALAPLVVALTLGLPNRSAWGQAESGQQAPPNLPANLRVAAVQMRSSRDLADNLSRARQHLARCAADGARVVVFPECSTTGYFDADTMRGFTAEQLAAAEGQLSAACREYRIYAIVGMPHRADGKLYNSAIVIDPRGQVLERYHKIQLAESWPDPGEHLSTFPIDGIRCSIIICHDERYPELVRLPVLAGARVIFYLSHESGLKHEQKIAPYRAQIQARAVENSVYVVQANAPANEDLSGSHGQSRIIAPDGNLVDEAGIFDEAVVSATLDLSRATGKLAQQSVDRGPLGAWWQAGLRQVRVIEPAREEAAAVSPGGSTVRVAGLVLKWIRGDKTANYARAEAMIRAAAAGGAQLVCTTECFLDGYAIADKSIPLDTFRALGEPIPGGEYFQKLSRLADELNIHLLAGMLEADGTDRFNTAVLLGPAGEILGKYRKQKLGHESLRNTPGTESKVFDTEFGRVGVMICADRTEPAIVAGYKANGADFLLCPSGGMYGPARNDPIVQARSRETELPILFVHPAEFLATAPDGTIAGQELLGDRLLVAPAEIDGAADSKRIVYFDLPLPPRGAQAAR
ncbi:MAG: carbon-nitrogen hydrolase family protein [Planctomycetaceae bacterium]|nr:carbon-nitrogen hydrolase family protein [Planctomycetaceae bacterium]